MAVKAGLSDGKSLSGNVPMDGVVNFDLGDHNEFMDLLDMVNSDSGADDNRAHFDFSSPLSKAQSRCLRQMQA